MSYKPFPRTLARMILDQHNPGLQRIELPIELGDETLFQLAAHLNKVSEDRYRALVIGNKMSPSVISMSERYEVECMPADMLAAFRKGDRLVVCFSGEFDDKDTLKPYAQVFPNIVPTGLSTVIGNSYPSLRTIAREYGVYEASGTTAHDIARAAAKEIATQNFDLAEVLTDCLEHAIAYTTLLYLCHSSSPSKTLNWDRAWWLHFAAALNRLEVFLRHMKTPADAAAITKIVHGAFSLPAPNSRNRFRSIRTYERNRDPKRAAGIYAKYWSGKESILDTVRLLSTGDQAADAGKRFWAMRELWSGFDYSEEKDKHPQLALHMPIRSDVELTEAWSSLSEDTFFSQKRSAESVRISGNSVLDTSSVFGTTRYIINLDPDRNSKLKENFKFHLSIEISLDCNNALKDCTKAFRISTKSGDIHLNATLSDASSFFGLFEIEGEISIDTLAEVITEAAKLEINKDAAQSVGILLSNNISVPIYWLPPSGSDLSTLIVAERRASGTAKGAPKVLGMRAKRNLESSFKVGTLLFLIGKNIDFQDETTNEIVINKHTGVLEGDLSSSSAGEFVFSNRSLSASATIAFEDANDQPASPILAAFDDKDTLSRIGLSDTELDDVRHGLSVYWLERMIEGGSLDKYLLGHCALIENGGSLDSLEFDEEKSVFACASDLTLIDQNIGWPRQHPIGNDGACQKFICTAEKLLQEWAPRDNDVNNSSLLNVTEFRVRSYIEAYNEMLSSARREIPRLDLDISWLRFPFSAALFRRAHDGTLRHSGWLLSPLHPVRILWSWCAEQLASDLSGEEGSPAIRAGLDHINGWNLPLSCKLSHDRIAVSIPLVWRARGYFERWSSLLELDEESPRQFGKIGEKPFPGRQSSGLGSRGVQGAINDYLKANPFTSSLTIELASRNESMSLGDDNFRSAVIDALVELANGEDAKDLIGGLHIVEKSSPAGATEAGEELERNLLRSGHEHAFSWKSANSRTPSDISSHLKLSDDSPVSIRRAPSATEMGSSQSFPELPVKRFLISDAPIGGHTGVIFHLNSKGKDDSLRSLMSSALETAEHGARQLQCSVSTALAHAGSAKWLATGTILLDPNAIGNNIASFTAMGGDKVLWDWRPTTLERKTGTYSASDASSAYAVIAQLPGSIAAKLKDNLSTSFPGIDPDRTFQDLVSVLAQQGIGLSSLLNRGRNDVTGAVGFYCALRTLRKIRPLETNCLQLVIPIDALDIPISSLAENNIGSHDSRADLVLIDIRGTREKLDVSLSPIEVKMYNHASTKGDRSAAARQVDASRKHFEKIIQNMERTATPGKACTRRMIFSSLVELGLQLSDRRSLLIEGELITSGEILSAIMASKSTVKVIDGFVLYFDSHTESGSTHNLSLSPEFQGVHWIELRSKLVADAMLRDEKSGLFEQIGEEIFERLGLAEEHEPISAVRIGKAKDAQQKTSQSSGEEETESNRAIAGEVDAPTQSDSAPPPSRSKSISENHSNMSNKASKSNGYIDICVGTPIDVVSRTETHYIPSDTRLNQLNIGIVGDLGTGKTQFIKSFIYQASNQKSNNRGASPKFLIFDYKRDYSDQEFVSCINAKVVKPRNIPLNLFDISLSKSINPQYDRARFFTDCISKIYNIGQVQRSRLQRAVMSAYDVADSPTIKSILDNYEGSDDSVSAILEALIYSEAFADDDQSAVSFSDYFDQSLVISLNELGGDNQLKIFLVTFFLNLYYEYMHNREKKSFISHEIDGERTDLRFIDSYLLIDEADNILVHEFEVLRRILLEGREFGVGVILSSQYLSHFKTKNTRWSEPLLTWCIHRVPNIRDSDISMLGIDTEKEDFATRIKSLRKHQCLFKKANQVEFIRGKPFYEFFGHD